MHVLFSEDKLRKNMQRRGPSLSQEMEKWLRGIVSFRLSLIKRDFKNIVEISCGERIFENSLFLTPHHTHFEILPLQEQSADLIFHSFLLHYINDMPGVLAQIMRTLRPDGLFMGIFFGGESLVELKTCLMQAEIDLCGGASPYIAPLLSPQEAGMLLQRAGFQLPVVDRERVTLYYPDLKTLLKDIQKSGQNNPMWVKGKFSKSLMNRAETIYRKKYSNACGQLVVTLDILVMSGWAYHQNQQKPLLPGSAEVSLLEVI